MTPEAIAIATERAASDAALLARLLAEGKVVRANDHGHAAILFRNATRPKVNLAIRPKRKKGKR